MMASTLFVLATQDAVSIGVLCSIVATLKGHTKSIIVATISLLPWHWQPRVAAVVRRAWRGFRNA